MSQAVAAASTGSTALLRDLLLIAALVLPGVTWLATADTPAGYLMDAVPPGQFLYVLSKLAGLYAIVLLWLQLLYGLLRGAAWEGPNGRWTVTVHRNLGLIVTALVLLHAGLLITGVSLRVDHFAYDLLAPNFNGAYYPSVVSLGITAAWLLIAVLIAAAMRRRSARRWVWAHRLGLAAFVLVFFHSLLVGSESRVGAMPYLYGVMGVVFCLALFYRFMLRARGDRALASARQNP